MIRRLSLLPLLVVAMLAVPASASAVNIRVGIGDQSPTMFTNANWKSLNLKLTRYFVEWNAIGNPTELTKAKQFVAAATAAHVKVLMHVSTDNIKSATPPKLPSVAAYRKDVGALIKLFKPAGVTDWGAWNEMNHKSQPTSKSPKRAAQFYGEMLKLCKGCNIVALDVLDQRGVEQYVAQFLKAAGPNAARIKVVGIHNYSEVNRRIGDKVKYSNSYPGTLRIIKAVQKVNKRAKFWYTETGGLTKQGAAFPCDDSRAANRTQYMFTLATRYAKYIQRLYTYNWTPPAVCAESDFDAGLVNIDGTPRPAFAIFKKNLKSFRR